MKDHIIDALLCDPNYRVTSDGRILTCKDKFGRISDTWREAGGKVTTPRHNTFYRQLNYFKTRLSVHRVVYKALIGPLDPSMVINHLDGDGLNNHPSNLEQVPQALNVLHGYRVLHRSPVRPGKINFEIADSIRFDRKAGLKVKELQAKYCLSKSQIEKVLNETCWNPASNHKASKAL